VHADASTLKEKQKTEHFQNLLDLVAARGRGDPFSKML